MPYTNTFVELNVLEAALDQDTAELHVLAGKMTKVERRNLLKAFERIELAFDAVEPEKI